MAARAVRWPITLREGALGKRAGPTRDSRPFLSARGLVVGPQVARFSHSRVVMERSTRPAGRRFAWERGLGCPPMPYRKRDRHGLIFLHSGSASRDCVLFFHMAAPRVGTMFVKRRQEVSGRLRESVPMHVVCECLCVPCVCVHYLAIYKFTLFTCVRFSVRKVTLVGSCAKRLRRHLRFASEVHRHSSGHWTNCIVFISGAVRAPSESLMGCARQPPAYTYASMFRTAVRCCSHSCPARLD